MELAPLLDYKLTEKVTLKVMQTSVKRKLVTNQSMFLQISRLNSISQLLESELGSIIFPIVLTPVLTFNLTYQIILYGKDSLERKINFHGVLLQPSELMEVLANMTPPLDMKIKTLKFTPNIYQAQMLLDLNHKQFLLKLFVNNIIQLLLPKKILEAQNLLKVSKLENPKKLVEKIINLKLTKI